MMRADVFQLRKGIHVKITKEVHAALRVESFKRGISMQEMFDEFANLVAMGDDRVLRLLDQYATRKIQDKIKGFSKRGLQHVGLYDSDTLYKLIEGKNDDDENEEDEA